jgi:DNA polymerase
MFVGEGPGFHEDQQGRPFVGAAGKYLDELLQGIGLSRDQVFITNIVKCRPPQNRDPLPDEIEACRPYLLRQITLIEPKLIVTLGRIALAAFLPDAQIGQVHGKPRKVGGRIVVPIYHPAAALRLPSWKPIIEQDFGRIPSLLAAIDELQQMPSEEQAEQLTLFE